MNKDYWEEYYGSFVGAKILSFDGMKDGFPPFSVLFKDTTIFPIQISQDPEGNGGGFIFGLREVK